MQTTLQRGCLTFATTCLVCCAHKLACATAGLVQEKAWRMELCQSCSLFLFLFLLFLLPSSFFLLLSFLSVFVVVLVVVLPSLLVI